MAKNCCQCQALPRLFNERFAEHDLRRYRKRGPDKTTRLLVAAIEAASQGASQGANQAQGLAGETLLDIGGGIGAIQLALLRAGLRHATDVDASPAYLEAAKTEATREGYGDRVTYVQGNFVALASELDGADIVTLERVICCFPDLPALVGASAAKAERLYGLVYPRDVWWMRLGARLINAVSWLQRSAFRFYVHSQATLDAQLSRAGLAWRYATTAGPWQVALYARPEALAAE